MGARTQRLLCLVPIIGSLLIGVSPLPADGGPAYKNRLEFYEQDALGLLAVNGARGQMQYNAVGPRFEFAFTASRLDKNTSYSLILSREPEVMLPARYQSIATGISDSGGNLTLAGSFEFHMDLLAAKMLLIPTDQPPDKPLTYEGKYLFAVGTIAHDDTESQLLCGGNQSPGPSDQLGLQAGDKAVDFSLYGIDGPASLTPGTAEQPLTLYNLFTLLQTKPVLLVNGAFT